jgi:5-methyltetrahydropteroyltriglutamate--homocysteine methyltransferase
MKHEYETVARAGLVLQVDCPDLAMGRHIQFADLSLEEFRKMARLHVEALDHALAGVPPDQARMHLCWGNYEGPHHYDVPLADILDIVFAGRAGAVSFEAANPRHAHEWRVFRTSACRTAADRSGVIDSTTNCADIPSDRRTHQPLRPGWSAANVIAGTDCGSALRARPPWTPTSWSWLSGLAEALASPMTLVGARPSSFHQRTAMAAGRRRRRSTNPIRPAGTRA